MKTSNLPMGLNDCHVRAALKAMGGKWKPILLYQLNAGPRRFGELRRSVPDVTQKMLTQQLRELERDGLVSRKVYHEVPPKVEYALTKHGKTVEPVLTALCKWGKIHMRKTARAHLILPAKDPVRADYK